MSLRFSKIKNWKKAELLELGKLVNQMSNDELARHYNVPITNIVRTLIKYEIQRDPDFIKELKSHKGEDNSNWRGGLSQDGARYSRIQRARHPEHKAARDAVYRALKEGRLLKPIQCQDCGEEKPLQGHHESYDKNKYLEVIWVCRTCHRIRHEGKH